MTVLKVLPRTALGSGARGPVAPVEAPTAARRARPVGERLRDSGLVRLLMDAVEASVRAESDRESGSAETPEQSREAAAPDVFARGARATDLQHALMAFAQALAHSLRAHPERDELRALPTQHRPWGQASQRVDQLATRSDGSDLVRQQELVSAFAGLQRALGRADADDPAALQQRLHAFLQALAGGLGDGPRDWSDATQPGSLIDVRA